MTQKNNANYQQNNSENGHIPELRQQGKDRVDIDIESNNGMKDFLIEYEYNREEEGVTYIKSNGYRFALSEPEEPTAEQLEYIQEKVDIMTAAMVSKNYDRITEVQKICADIITADGRTKAAADINGDGVFMLAELGISSHLYRMLPYLVTLVVLAFTSKKSRAPKAEGIPYDKGSR